MKSQLERVFTHLTWPKGYNFNVDQLFDVTSIMAKKKNYCEFKNTKENCCILCGIKIKN